MRWGARNPLMACGSSVMCMALTSTPAVRGLFVKVGGSVSSGAFGLDLGDSGLKSEVNESETASEPSLRVGLLPFAAGATLMFFAKRLVGNSTLRSDGLAMASSPFPLIDLGSESFAE